MKCLKKYYKIGLLSIFIMSLSSCGMGVVKNANVPVNNHCHLEHI